MMWLLSIAGAYLVGSVPFGLMLGKARGIDIRAHGSQNIGATNVWRVLGKKLGLLCFMLDALKGAAPVIIAGALGGTLGESARALTQQQMWLWLAVAAAAVVGHMFSIFLGFRGGKGVATAFGGLIAMWPLLSFSIMAAVVLWVIVLRVMKFVALASMTAAAGVPMAVAVQLVLSRGADQSAADALVHGSPLLIATIALALLVVIRHRTNVQRLLRGEEPRIGAG